MKLVLCIDRDNDLGSKAHLQCPIIGREDNVNAALQLGLIDPEDSDVNAIFDGIKRVVIRQSESLESTYYTIKKLFEDPKIANYFFIPVGLTLILFAIFS